MRFNTPLKLSQLASMLQAEYEGEPNFPVSGLNEIHMVEPGDLTFVDHPKYYDKALNSKATTILINKKSSMPCRESLVVPRKAL